MWFQWDESLPAEECLWSLETYLVSICISATGSESLWKPVSARETENTNSEQDKP